MNLVRGFFDEFTQITNFDTLHPTKNTKKHHVFIFY